LHFPVEGIVVINIFGVGGGNTKLIFKGFERWIDLLILIKIKIERPVSPANNLLRIADINDACGSFC